MKSFKKEYELKTGGTKKSGFIRAVVSGKIQNYKLQGIKEPSENLKKIIKEQTPKKQIKEKKKVEPENEYNLNYFYDKFIKMMNSPSKRSYNFFMKYLKESNLPDYLKRIFEDGFFRKMKENDFYATPIELFKNIFVIDLIKRNNNFLEGTAGVGNIVQGIKNIKNEQNKNFNIYANEYDKDLYMILKNLQESKNIKVTNKDYFNITNEIIKKNNIDCLILNPPFNSGRKKNDKIFYKFLIHTLKICDGNGTDIIFICPPLINKDLKTLQEFDPYKIYDKMPKKYNKLIENEENLPAGAVFLGNLSGFGGTGFSAHIYYFKAYK